MNPQPLHAAPSGFERDRDREQRDMAEQQHRALQQEDMARHDRDRDRDRDREDASRQHRDAVYTPRGANGPPHHSSAGSLPIHQPVASRIATTIHSPGGLLANHGGSAPPMPIGAPSGPAPGFGAGPMHGPPHGGPGPAATTQHAVFAPLPHGPGGQNGSMGGSAGPASIFGGPLQEGGRGGPPEGGRGLPQLPIAPGTGPGHQIPAGPGMTQGQQPILNVSALGRSRPA